MTTIEKSIDVEAPVSRAYNQWTQFETIPAFMAGVDGPGHGGLVTFHRLDDRTTRVHLQMQYHPETLTEKAGAALGAVGTRIRGDLERFKNFIEARGQETGGWRGDVDRPPQAGER